MHAYTISLEAKLKEPIPTSCSTCEMHALKNLELSHYVDCLQDVTPVFPKKPSANLYACQDQVSCI
jgi:hypothetical protein